MSEVWGNYWIMSPLIWRPYAEYSVKQKNQRHKAPNVLQQLIQHVETVNNGQKKVQKLFDFQQKSISMSNVK